MRKPAKTFLVCVDEEEFDEADDAAHEKGALPRERLECHVLFSGAGYLKFSCEQRGVKAIKTRVPAPLAKNKLYKTAFGRRHAVMNRHYLALWLVIISLVLPSVAAQTTPAQELDIAAGMPTIIAPLVQLFGPEGLAGIYNDAPYLIDSILVLIIFIAVGKVAFKRFNSGALPVVVGIILAIGFGVFEFQMAANGTPFTLANFGPIAVLVMLGFITFFLYSLLPFVKNTFIRFLIAFTIVFAVIPPEVMAWLYLQSPYFAWIYFLWTIGLFVVIISLFMMLARSFPSFGNAANTNLNKDVGQLFQNLGESGREVSEEKARQRRENARTAADSVGAAMRSSLAAEMQAVTAGKQGMEYLQESVRTVNSYLTQVESLVAPQRKSGFDAPTFRQQLAQQSGSQMEQHFSGQQQAIQQAQAPVNATDAQAKVDEYLRLIDEMKQSDVFFVKNSERVLDPTRKLIGLSRTNLQPKFAAELRTAQNDVRAAEMRSGTAQLDLGVSRAITLDGAHAQDMQRVENNIASLETMHRNLADVTAALVKQYGAVTSALQARKGVYGDAKDTIVTQLGGALREFQEHAKAYLQSLEEKPRKKAEEAAQKVQTAITKAKDRLDALETADRAFETAYAAFQTYQTSGAAGQTPVERVKQFSDGLEQTRATAVQIAGYLSAARTIAQTASKLASWYPPNPPAKANATAQEAIAALTTLRNTIDQQLRGLVEAELRSLAAEAPMAKELTDAIKDAEEDLVRNVTKVMGAWQSQTPVIPTLQTP